MQDMAWTLYSGKTLYARLYSLINTQADAKCFTLNLFYLHASFTPSGEYSIMEVVVMKKSFFASGVLSIALASIVSAEGAYASAESGDHYTRAQLKQLTHEAHTPEQYKNLAGYYEKRQQDYLQQAVEEKKEWERRNQNIMGVAAKYPRPVDSARYLYEYYVEMATEAGALSAKYNQLAEPTAPVTTR